MNFQFPLQTHINNMYVPNMALILLLHGLHSNLTNQLLLAITIGLEFEMIAHIYLYVVIAGMYACIYILHTYIHTLHICTYVHNYILTSNVCTFVCKLDWCIKFTTKLILLGVRKYICKYSSHYKHTYIWTVYFYYVTCIGSTVITTLHNNCFIDIQQSHYTDKLMEHW